jgi:cyclic pyranopterin phosphate synthase
MSPRPSAAVTALVDAHGREISYLRVSVTDRCNLHCAYCRPAAADKPATAGVHGLRSELLSFEEIERVVGVAAGLGVIRVRLTGGEPLLRRGVAELCGRLARLPGIQSVGLTTNGVLLDEHLDALRAAGLNRLNISLDTLDRERFHRLTGKDALIPVLVALRRAARAGFPLVKLNCVLQRGVNDDALSELVDFAGRLRLNIRFIEAMPLPGAPHAAIFLSAAEARARLQRTHRLLPLPLRAPAGNAAGPASDFRVAATGQIISFVAALTDRFCRRCNRLRMLADGRLKPCLFAPAAVRLRPLLRRGASDAVLARGLAHAVRVKPPAHPFLLGPGLVRGLTPDLAPDPKGPDPGGPSDPMVEIGG